MLVAFAAVVEAVAGLVLIVDPSLVARLLLGADLSAAGEAVGRVAGFGLCGLGLSRSARGLFLYNMLASIFFLYLGVRGGLAGLLLWPAFALHGCLAVLLARLLLSRSLR
ncbi:MAG TPA: hypothetical protein VFE35_09895 [Candidatus Cybelea sp.]|nr:hypothetical protein [Candidatus Cybelea sp.]